MRIEMRIYNDVSALITRREDDVYSMELRSAELVNMQAQILDLE